MSIPFGVTDSTQIWRKGLRSAGKLRDEIFDEEFDVVAEAPTGGVNDVVGARPHFAD
jgi:hypothetical protein